MEGDPTGCPYPQPIPCRECDTIPCAILADGNIVCCECGVVREVPNG